ncbi:MAG: tetratricopeptide repeat protein [Paludibacteraceae bacterium]|nr:tetratricopeptide repeat protein [Paludibacteraceae bacterium]
MKKITFLMALMAIVMMTSCSKIVDKPQEIQVTPEDVAVVGGEIKADITGTFPPKKFARKGILKVTPVLKYGDKEVLSESETYVGEKAKANGKTVSYKKGGKYAQSCKFKYTPDMAGKELKLYLRCEATCGKKVYDIPDVLIADGINTTATLANTEEQAVPTPSKFQTVVEELTEADINFIVAQSNLRDSELSADDMKALQEAIKAANKDKARNISQVEISGYASPEGGLDLNERLANSRQANTEKYIRGKVNGNNTRYISSTTAEDWEGFRAELEQSDIQDKELVIRVLEMYSDPEERETQIRNLSQVYSDLAKDILPKLRRSRILVTTAVTGKSDEQLLKEANENPEQLSVEELLYAASVAPTQEEQIALNKKAAELYNDYRAYNNLGMIAYNQNKLDEAEQYFQKALALAPNNPDVNYNAGLVDLAKGDVAKAEQHLGKAAGTKGDLDGALGTLYTMKGDYNNAKQSYGTSRSNNAALQQILDKYYQAARQTLDQIEAPNAKTAYLKAILAARTNDREGVYSNMKDAVAGDAAYKTRAKTDVEFAKYKEDAKFQAIIK